MKIVLLVFMLFYLITCTADQNNNKSSVVGVKFQQKNLDEIFTLAKAEQKLIMVDTYSDG